MTNQEAIETIKANYPPKNNSMLREALDIALALLKAQEPRLVTIDDFKDADECGYITAWCEASNGLFAECITVGALEEKDFRYWTSKPTDEQRKAVKRE